MEVKTVKTFWKDGEFKQNTYVISCGKDSILIDAGAEVGEVEKLLNGTKVQAVFVTHCHYDHILYIEQYAKKFNCPIYVNEHSKQFFNDPFLNGSSVLGKSIAFNPKNIKFINDKNRFLFNDLAIKVVYTPGHSIDSLCYLVKDITQKDSHPTLFTGDLLFAKAIGRTDLKTGNKEMLLKSIFQTLSLDFCDIYPGHARKTTKEEQLHNFDKGKE